MNEALLTSYYVSYCETLLAIRKSGDWKDWHPSWDDYVQRRWSLSKSRAKLLCQFAQFRNMALEETFGTLPETPEQVKSILGLPQKLWIETWDLVISDNPRLPITAQNVESTLQRFGIYAHKTLSPEAKKAIRVRRAAKTMAEMSDGEKLVNEIGGKALGKNWTKAVEVVIDADQERMNQLSVARGT